MSALGNILKGVVVGLATLYGGPAGTSLSTALFAGSAVALAGESSEQTMRKQKRLQTKLIAQQALAKQKEQATRQQGARASKERARRRASGGLTSTIFGGSPVGGNTTLG